MRTWVLAFSLCFGFPFGLLATEAPYGEWKFVELIYQGQRLPLPNPSLNMRWTFFPNGVSRLYWDRGTTGFCERWAYFKIEPQNEGPDLLYEKVFNVNPRNEMSCAQDPDMQLHKETRTPFDLQGSEMHLHFPLGDEQLTYVLKHPALRPQESL